MARLSEIPKEHRDIAARFPYLERMPAAEVRHRAAHIHGLEERCPMTGEAQQLMLAHSAHLSAALPIGEYLAQIKHLNDLAAQAPGTGLDSPAFDFRRAADKIRSENLYVPGLIAACDRWLLGQDPMYPNCDIGGALGATEGIQ